MFIDSLMFDINGIEVPGIHFQDQKIAMTITGNNQTTMNETEYVINNWTKNWTVYNIYIYIYMRRPSYK